MNESINSWQSLDLPVNEIIPELQDKIKTNPTIILQAPPGAGKSTLIPLALLEEAKAKGKKILMLEPRRLAAKSIAQRMADLLNEEVGATVGYRIRFESRISEKTIIEVITEGILTRMLLQDNALENVGIIIFDEFHERSIHADLSLALSRESQHILREDLRLLIMSATLDAEGMASKLNGYLIKSEGRQYPVKTIQLEDADAQNLTYQCTSVIQRAYHETDGDILVFLPGQREITEIQQLLSKNTDFLVYPLYGALPFAKQWKAIQPDKNGRRRVVLATSIAETSLTIEGINTVVDSGWGRGVSYDPGSGLSRLYTYRISIDEANQRAGRAGRLRPGSCYRMWTTATHHRLDDHRKPEILDQDLTALTLSLYAWGIHDPEELFWLDPLPKGPLAQAHQLLEQLGATEDGMITEMGKKMAGLPCHPRIAHMLIASHGDGDLALACDIAALMEERDPLQRDETSTDISLRIDWLRKKRRDNSSEFVFKKINKVADSYASIFNEELSSDSYDPFACGIILSYAYPERIAGSQGNRSGRFQLANGHVVKLPKEDDLYAAAWIVVANMHARDSVGKVFLAAQINPTDLASQVKEKEVIMWDERKEELITEKQMKVGGLILSAQPLPDPDPVKCHQVTIQAIRKSKGHLLTLDEEADQLLHRIKLVRDHFPQLGIPLLTMETLIEKLENWITPYIKPGTSGEDLKKINLSDVIMNTLLSYEQQQLLHQYAPEKINVPSGSKIKINYLNEGSPVLAVRLQEMFGAVETPRICHGKQSLLLHLLSPGFKPVQVTSDLASFWKTTYFEVKKELKGRYPKHVWPDDPLQAEATHRAKKRN